MSNKIGDVVTVSGSPITGVGMVLHAQIYAATYDARQARKQVRPFSLRGVGPFLEAATWSLFAQRIVTGNITRTEVGRAFTLAVSKRAGHAEENVPPAEDILKAIVSYGAACSNYVREYMLHAFSQSELPMIRFIGPVTSEQANAPKLSGNAFRAVRLQTMLDVLEQIPGRRACDTTKLLVAKLEPVKDVFPAEYVYAESLAKSKSRVLGPSLAEQMADSFKP
ncbi:Uncharacterised protein [Candidatus Burarchaeum australiense]|nr:Uncharacterised protein [Candidatus Burarchaeum australiense]